MHKKKPYIMQHFWWIFVNFLVLENKMQLFDRKFKKLNTQSNKFPTDFPVLFWSGPVWYEHIRYWAFSTLYLTDWFSDCWNWDFVAGTCQNIWFNIGQKLTYNRFTSVSSLLSTMSFSLSFSIIGFCFTSYQT